MYIIYYCKVVYNSDKMCIAYNTITCSLILYQVDRKSYGDRTDEATPTDDITCQDSSELISKFAKFIYGYHGTDIGPIKTRVVLCHIYHHAIHDRWFQARDLMLMTHLQEGISVADINTQVRSTKRDGEMFILHIYTMS